MESNSSVRLTDTNKEFLNNIALNVKKKDLSYAKSTELLHKYFKANNIKYLEFINWVAKNGI